MVLYSGETYFIAEFLIQRGIALVYFFAFLVIYRQYIPLVGEKGLKPIKQFTKDKNFWQAPSIFYFYPKDHFIKLMSTIGIILSLIGIISIPDQYSQNISIIFWLTIWLLFISFRITGQEFWNQGAILVEIGFLAIFLGTTNFRSSEIMIWLFRWVLFRIMFNSGLTKLKGDNCWKKLTCLNYQFETQPFPGPLSRKLHFSPKNVKKIGMIFTWFTMLIIPWFYFFPQPYASFAGIITILYQTGIFLSGNYSWLNISTITISFATISDQFIQSTTQIALPTTQKLLEHPQNEYLPILALFIALTSARPIYDMFFTNSKEVRYGIIPILNIYGKFPDIETQREEIVFEAKPEGQKTWKQYRQQINPPKLEKRPSHHAPYYHRLDYQLYTKRRQKDLENELLEKLMKKILENDEYVLKLFSKNPFENKQPPESVRMVKYKYRFAKPSEKQKNNIYWKRERQEVIKEISKT